MQPLAEILSLLLKMVWTAAVYATVAGWLYILVESIAAVVFARFAFALGLKHVEFTDALGWPAPFIPSSAGKTGHTKFKVFEDGRYVLFRYRGSGFAPIKGTITLHDGELHVVGRLPLGVMLFLSAWVVGWTAAWLTSLLEGDLRSLGFLVLGWGFAAAIWALGLVGHRARFRKAYEEVKAELGWTASAPSRR